MRERLVEGKHKNNFIKQEGYTVIFQVPNPCPKQMNYDHLFSFNHGSKISHAWLGKKSADFKIKIFEFNEENRPFLNTL